MRKNIDEVGSDVRSITISLVGSRAAWNLLEQQIKSGGRPAAACSCAALAEVWKVDHACLDNLHGEFIDLTKVNAIRFTNQALWRREQELFRRNPVTWFMRTVDGWSLDGAALRLDQLLLAHVVNPTDRTCRVLTKSAESGEIHDRVFTGALNPEELEAKASFFEWLKAGCPAS